MENVRRVDVEFSTDSGEIRLEGGCIRKAFIDERKVRRFQQLLIWD